MGSGKLSEIEGLIEEAGSMMLDDLPRALGRGAQSVDADCRRLARCGVVVRDKGPVRPGLLFRSIGSHDVSAAVHDLSTGNPDPSLLLRETEASTAVGDELYGGPRVLPEFLRAIRATAPEMLAGDSLVLFPGGLSALETVLSALVDAGDAVLLEDPTYPGDIGLVRALGLHPVPVEVDEHGLVSSSVETALANSRVAAAVVRPRAQNPTGAHMSPKRRDELHDLFVQAGVLVVEEDHAGPVAGAPLVSLMDLSESAMFLRISSVSKWLGPDLRLAAVSGTDDLVRLLDRRRMLGGGWVSRRLQATAANRLGIPKARERIQAAMLQYAARRRRICEAWDGTPWSSHPGSGINLWIEVRDEDFAVDELGRRGWRVAPGSMFTRRNIPAIRVSMGALTPGIIDEFEDAIRAVALLDQRFTPKETS